MSFISKFIKVFQEFKKRKQFIRFIEGTKTILSSWIFTIFLYKIILFRWYPPFWLICLIFVTTSFFALRRKPFKCFVILLIPTLISKRGRSAIVGYIFILTLSGSVVNIVKNVEVTVECLSCAQEHAKGLIQGLIGGLKRPFIELERIIQQIQQHIQHFMEEIEDRLNSLKDKINFITESIEKVFGWLKKISELCQENFGSPYDMCIKALHRMIEKCEEDFGIASFLCNLNYLLQPLCISMEILDFICIAIDYVGDSVLNVIEELTQKFTEMIKNMFYFNTEFNSDFDFDTSSSRNWTQIKKLISNELKEKTNELISIVGFMEFLSLVFVLWLFYKYQTQYMQRDDYKNFYISHYFYEMESVNVLQGHDPVLPLRGDENDLYADLKAIWLIRYERRKLLRSFPFLLLSNIQIFAILLTDFGLHWILDTIGEYQKTHFAPIATNQRAIQVSGQGPLADMYRDVVRDFESILRGTQMDYMDCLPNPSPPNWERFRVTILLLVICWIFLLVEPLSLRAQQYVMDTFHPERARKRSAWLHEEISRRRISFLEIARQKMQQIMQGGPEVHQGGFFRIIWASLRQTRLMSFFLGHQWREFCLSCATPSNQEDLDRCYNISCQGTFCIICLSKEEFSCPLCNMKYMDESLDESLA